MWVKSREDIHSHKVASKKVLVLTYNKEKEPIGIKSEKNVYILDILKCGFFWERASIYVKSQQQNTRKDRTTSWYDPTVACKPADQGGGPLDNLPPPCPSMVPPIGLPYPDRGWGSQPTSSDPSPWLTLFPTGHHQPIGPRTLPPLQSGVGQLANLLQPFPLAGPDLIPPWLGLSWVDSTYVQIHALGL